MLDSKYQDTCRVGDIVNVSIPQRSGATWLKTGTVTGIRIMQATGRIFLTVDGKSGIRPEWCTKVSA